MLGKRVKKPLSFNAAGSPESNIAEASEKIVAVFKNVPEDQWETVHAEVSRKLKLLKEIRIKAPSATSPAGAAGTAGVGSVVDVGVGAGSSSAAAKSAAAPETKLQNDAGSERKGAGNDQAVSGHKRTRAEAAAGADPAQHEADARGAPRRRTSAASGAQSVAQGVARSSPLMVTAEGSPSTQQLEDLEAEASLAAAANVRRSSADETRLSRAISDSDPILALLRPGR